MLLNENVLKQILLTSRDPIYTTVKYWVNNFEFLLRSNSNLEHRITKCARMSSSWRFQYYISIWRKSKMQYNALLKGLSQLTLNQTQYIHFRKRKKQCKVFLIFKINTWLKDNIAIVTMENFNIKNDFHFSPLLIHCIFKNLYHDTISLAVLFLREQQFSLVFLRPRM